MGFPFTTTNRWEDLKHCCPDPEIILDCGAHTGQTARHLRQAYPRATIYCFEPVQRIFEALLDHGGPLNIRPIRSAVSDHTGSAEIFLTASTESNSLLPFLEHHNPLADPHRVIGRQRVPTCRLDDWIVTQQIAAHRVHILKMDVQGHELSALRGAPRLLQHTRALLLEVSFVPLYQGAPLIGDIDAFLGSRGYDRAALYPSIKPQWWADGLYLRRT